MWSLYNKFLKQLKGFLDSFLYKLVFSDRLSGCLVPLKSADKDNGWSGRSAGWSIVTLTQEHGFDSRFYWNGSQKRRALWLPQTVEISKMPTKRTIWGVAVTMCSRYKGKEDIFLFFKLSFVRIINFKQSYNTFLYIEEIFRSLCLREDHTSSTPVV